MSRTRNQWTADKYGKCQIAPALNGLHTARKPEYDCGNLAAPAVRGHPALQAPLEQCGTVQPQIHQKDVATTTPAKSNEPVVLAAVSSLTGGLTA